MNTGIELGTSDWIFEYGNRIRESDWNFNSLVHSDLSLGVLVKWPNFQVKCSLCGGSEMFQCISRSHFYSSWIFGSWPTLEVLRYLERCCCWEVSSWNQKEWESWKTGSSCIESSFCRYQRSESCIFWPSSEIVLGVTRGQISVNEI